MEIMELPCGYKIIHSVEWYYIKALFIVLTVYIYSEQKVKEIRIENFA